MLGITFKNAIGDRKVSRAKFDEIIYRSASLQLADICIPDAKSGGHLIEIMKSAI